MKTLQELHQKYNFKSVDTMYEPDPDCRFCKGVGEYRSKALDGMKWCACLFFGPNTKSIAPAIAKWAKGQNQ